MRVIQKTTMDRVFNKLYRDLGLEDISEDDVVEWTGEVLDHIGVVSMLEEHVAFIEVNNHKANLPNNLTSIIQVAKNTKYNNIDKGVCIDTIPKEVVSDSYTTDNSSCTNCDNKSLIDFVPLDCKGNLIEDYEVSYYRPFFDLQYEYYNWSNSILFQQYFVPVRLSNKTFFNTIVCEENPQIYLNSKDEYTISGNILKLSFKEGQIALAYYSLPLDPETGYPMIPDEVSVIEAIVSYIIYKYMKRMWYLGREGFADKYKQAESDYNWYITQAKNKLFGPYGIDDFQDLLEQNKQLIPNLSRYKNFFSGNSYKELIRYRTK